MDTTVSYKARQLPIDVLPKLFKLSFGLDGYMFPLIMHYKTVPRYLLPKHDTTKVILYYRSNRLVAWGLGVYYPTDREYLVQVFVDEASRGKGIAKVIYDQMRTFVKRCKYIPQRTPIAGYHGLQEVMTRRYKLPCKQTHVTCSPRTSPSIYFDRRHYRKRNWNKNIITPAYDFIEEYLSNRKNVNDRQIKALFGHAPKMFQELCS